MPYLDQYSRKFKHRPIFKGKERDAILGQIIDALDDWRLSPFEHESDCRYILRAALCLEGHGWPAADTEASALIDVGLKQNGAVRPSWGAGQPDYTECEAFCRICFAALSEAQQKLRARFCSMACAKTQIEQTGWKTSGAARRAYEMVRKANKIHPRQCEHCGTEFHVHSKSAPDRFCSKPCRNASLKTRCERRCEHCGTSFLPSIAKVNRYCSRPCYYAARKAERHLRQCECCGTSFVTNVSTAKYCSKTCISKVHYYRRRAAAVILPFPTISPAEFDQEFVIAA